MNNELKFAELIRAYVSPSSQCEIHGHNEINSLSSTFHNKDAGATWIETFICTSCGDTIKLVVCDRYHETLESWLDPKTVDPRAVMGECQVCGAEMIYEDVYWGGEKWG